MFIEINVRKTKWLMLKTFQPANQQDDYFFKSIETTLDQYQQTYEQFSMQGRFNAEPTESSLC